MYRIRFCPWCGKSVGESAMKTQRATGGLMTLKKRLAKVKTERRMLKVLGPPDKTTTSQWKPTKADVPYRRVVRHHHYPTLLRGAEVIVAVYSDKTIGLRVIPRM
jgi:hypothetical protein